MSIQNLIIYNFSSLYHILEEIGLDLNFNIISVDNENSLNEQVSNLNNYLVISNKRHLNISNQLVLDKIPINIFNLNSREMLINNKKLKLTEKEINTITYLSKSNKPVSIDELQEKVWSYQSDMETHTVETHIYRLRKKILNMFNDNEFIISKKNGYQIK